MRKLITTDCHLIPPPWLLDELPERLRSHLQSRTEQYDSVERDGERYLVFPGRTTELLRRLGYSTEMKIESDDELARVFQLGFLADANPSWDAARLLEDLGRENVVAAVLINNVVRGTRREPIDVEAQIAYCQVVNDWLADNYRDHLDCLAPGIHLPALDPAACAAELERAARQGTASGTAALCHLGRAVLAASVGAALGGGGGPRRAVDPARQRHSEPRGRGECWARAQRLRGGDVRGLLWQVL